MAKIEVQFACPETWDSLPTEEDFADWVEAALPNDRQDRVVTGECAIW